MSPSLQKDSPWRDLYEVRHDHKQTSKLQVEKHDCWLERSCRGSGVVEISVPSRGVPWFARVRVSCQRLTLKGRAGLRVSPGWGRAVLILSVPCGPHPCDEQSFQVGLTRIFLKYDLLGSRLRFSRIIPVPRGLRPRCIQFSYSGLHGVMYSWGFWLLPERSKLAPEFKTAS